MKAMKLMSLLQLFAFVLPRGRAWQVSRVLTTSSSFAGQQWHQRRSFARQSRITMMPEGPEVRTLVDQLQGAVGRRLADIQFLSGRYVHHGRPNGFEAFSGTITPTFQPHSATPESIDIIQEWTAKGKFIYITLDDGINPPTEDDDFQRSIWITLGMTGQFVNENIHQQDVRHARWYVELLDVESDTTSKVYYHDQRNFGTLKFCMSREELAKKLESLGPDILNDDTTEDTFLALMTTQKKSDTNICKFLMDQSKLSGVGNYILSECLYRAKLDPFASLDELDETMRQSLFREIQAVARESYEAQGLTRDGGTFRNVEGNRGQFVFQLQCYGRKLCAKGNEVIRETEGPHKRAIWYTNDQLFMSLAERKAQMSTLSNSIGSNKEATTSDTKKVVGEISGDLISGLEDQGWKNALSDAIRSESFQNLESFLEQERATGATIYPPQEDVFSAFNLCPLDKVKVVIVGQDPYHGPGQGHGLAFSVRHGIKPPPSLKNIVREAMEDVGIDEPTHGDLEHWAKQGVLLFNTVLTVRRGEANSHSKQGWEDFTDAVIRVLNERQGVVFLLWGNPAAKKAKGVDDSKHVIIQTSHPSPLGVTKTKSPFRGSRCFSRANKALEDMGSAPINWSIL